MMFASFHSKGSIPSAKDKLNNVANGMLICSTLSSSSLRSPQVIYYPSYPVFSILPCLGVQLVVLNSPTLSLRSTFFSVTDIELISSLVNTELSYLFKFSSKTNASVMMLLTPCFENMLTHMFYITIS